MAICAGIIGIRQADGTVSEKPTNRMVITPDNDAVNYLDIEAKRRTEDPAEGVTASAGREVRWRSNFWSRSRRRHANWSIVVLILAISSSLACSSSHSESDPTDVPESSAPTGSTEQTSGDAGRTSRPEKGLLVDHGLGPLPWWKRKEACLAGTQLHGSRSEGEISCRLPSGEFHGRRTRFGRKPVTHYYLNGRLLSGAVPSEGRCASDAGLKQKLTSLGHRSPETICVVRPSSFPGVQRVGTTGDEGCVVFSDLVYVDCVGYKHARSARILARAGWKRATAEIRQLMAEDYVVQMSHLRLATYDGEYVSTNEVGNNIVVGFHSVQYNILNVGCGDSRQVVSRYEYRFDAAGTRRLHSNTLVESCEVTYE